MLQYSPEGSWSQLGFTLISCQFSARHTEYVPRIVGSKPSHLRKFGKGEDRDWVTFLAHVVGKHAVLAL